MKKGLCVLAFLFCVASSFAQWKWLNPKPSGLANNKIIFTEANKGFLFNENGDLFKTSNGGVDWEFAQNFPTTLQMDLHDSTGIIIGNNAVYLSRDNGNSWLNKNVTGSGNINRVDIVSRDTIILLANTGGQAPFSTLIISTDRGENWFSINTSVNLANQAFEFADSKTGYASGGSPDNSNYGLYKTVDGGVTWQLTHPLTNTATILCIKFYDDRFGYVYRESDHMLRTSDGGLTWTDNSIGLSIYSIAFANKNTAYAAGESGVVYKTIDAGLTWQLAGPGGYFDAYDLYSVYFFDDTNGFVTGRRGRILKTTDGGTTWHQHSPFYEDVMALSFGNSTTGYVSKGVDIYKTTDAGESWSFKFSMGTGWAGSRNFNNSVFFNADTGIFTATYNAHIYKTYDGGNNWTVIYPAPASYEYVAGMSFINSKIGYISLRTSSGYGLFKTTDGGESWNEIGSYQNFYKLHFINENTGYATHLQKVFKTTDGGNNWTEVLSVDYDVNSIYVMSPSKLIVAGDQGHLLTTLNSGQTWQLVQLENYFGDFYTVKFANEMIGFLTGDRGIIFKTIDGGLTWQKENPIIYYDFRSIEFTGDSTVYIGGFSGCLLKNKTSSYRIDSLTVSDITACRAKVSARVIAAMSSVDSIWVQYGPVNFDSTVLSTPGAVTNAEITTGITLENLSAGTTYKARLKIFYHGVYFYSNTVSFSTTVQPTPVITAAGNVLSSSSTSGNQWYLDGNPIAGAVNQQLQATASGLYTVKVTQGNCPGILSAGHNLNITSTIDPALNRELRIYPNPVADELTFENDRPRSLSVQLSDVNGKVLISTEFRQRRESISVKQWAAGIYFIKVTDLKTKKMIARIIVKL